MQNDVTKDQNEDTIQDAQIVPSDNSTDTDILLNLESLIKSHISQIDKLKEENKVNQGMLNDLLLNDPTYQEHEKKAKEATKVKTKTKQELLKQPQAASLSEKVKEGKASLKELQSAMSEYLREYARMSGTNEIETDDGEVREIIYTAKLVKKSVRFK